MYSTIILYLTVLCGLGANGSPLVNEKRQLIPAFPANFPFQSLSGDQAGALAVIKSNNLIGFCTQLLNSGGQSEEDEEDDLLGDNTSNILPRQNVNVNSNSNQGQSEPGNSNSYSYSSSNSNNGGGGGSQTSVNYNLNGVAVPQPLTRYQPGAIQSACAQYLGNGGNNQNTATPTTGYNYISTGDNGTTIQMNGTSIVINGTAFGINGTTIEINSNVVNGTTININSTSIEINGGNVEINGTTIEINGTSVEISGTTAGINQLSFSHAAPAFINTVSVPLPAPLPAPSAVTIPAPVPPPPPPATAVPIPAPIPTQSAVPLPAPAPAPPPAPSPSLKPGIYFQNAFYGSGTDAPLRPIERQGLPTARFVPGQFHAYRYACAAVCARTPTAFAFTVKTNFRANQCTLVIGSDVDVENGDIVPIPGAQSGNYHLEGWNKYFVE